MLMLHVNETLIKMSLSFNGLMKDSAMYTIGFPTGSIQGVIKGGL